MPAGLDAEAPPVIAARLSEVVLASIAAGVTDAAAATGASALSRSSSLASLLAFSSLCEVRRASWASSASTRPSMSVIGVVAGAPMELFAGWPGWTCAGKNLPSPPGKTLVCKARTSASTLRSRASALAFAAFWTAALCAKAGTAAGAANARTSATRKGRFVRSIIIVSPVCSVVFGPPMTSRRQTGDEPAGMICPSQRALSSAGRYLSAAGVTVGAAGLAITPGAGRASNAAALT